MHEAYVLFIILGGTLGLFISGYWRYDIVALVALMAAVAVGAVPFSNTFSGFSNPAVITVACVMIVSQAITRSGVVDFAVKKLTPVTNNAILHMLSLCFLAGLLSAFMNNIGALALLMPIAIQTANKSNRSPSMVLMPIAFSSALGGLCTVIGTPPNLLIATYRQQITGKAFAMFDFSPVGIALAIAGILFIALIGWRLIPYKRKAPSQAEDLFQIKDYMTEIKVPANSPIVDKTVRDLENLIEGDFTIIGMIRKKSKQLIISASKIIYADDILIIEASHDDLKKLIGAGKLELVGEDNVSPEMLKSKDVQLAEAVVPSGSRIEGRSAQSMRLRSRFHTNLLAIAREGKPFKERLNHVKLVGGDVVLLQGDANNIRENIVNLGFLPLVERSFELKLRRKAYVPIFVFIIAILLAALQVLPVEISFAGAVLALVVFNIIPLRMLYRSIDWSIIVLLAALIPVGAALQTTGGTELIANSILNLTGHVSNTVLLGILLVLTMTISDVINNVATAVIMGPIAVSIANGLHVSIDPFLMAVAVGASCSFLTPIGHQNNTLVLGPGGYKFSDYFKMGLPVEIIVLVIAVPLIPWIWPF